MGALKISVVVPTYARPEALRRGLDGLATQTLPSDRFEVIVVDDGSPVPPRDVVAAFESRYPIRLLTKENGGLASARNAGAAAASGDLLLFLDDDILPCPEFLEAHLAAHEAHPKAVALGALPHPLEHRRDPFLYYLERVRHYDLFLRYGSAERIPLPPLNGNSSLARTAFLEAGGYDVSFSGYGGEDTEMGYRLLRRGMTFVYAPAARGWHYHAKDYAAYRKDMYASGVTMVAIVRRYPEVVSRVNLDIVLGEAGELSIGKKLKRAIWVTLDRRPRMVAALESLLARGSRLGLRAPLYPFFLVASHYHYARGMRDELARSPLR